ncbi:MAG: hypothetical protein K9K38_19130, partial [Rhodoferax sp.]|nr:hypothetical protein [Rhodoferax sp.]
MRRTVMLEGMQLLARHLGYAPKEWLLTYVNELLALPPNARGVSDLHEHLTQTLAEVKPWVSVPEYLALENELALAPSPTAATTIPTS